jgi:hypothetical protein
MAPSKLKAINVADEAYQPIRDGINVAQTNMADRQESRDPSLLLTHHHR